MAYQMLNPAQKKVSHTDRYDIELQPLITAPIQQPQSIIQQQAQSIIIAPSPIPTMNQNIFNQQPVYYQPLFPVSPTVQPSVIYPTQPTLIYPTSGSVMPTFVSNPFIQIHPQLQVLPPTVNQNLNYLGQLPPPYTSSVLSPTGPTVSSTSPPLYPVLEKPQPQPKQVQSKTQTQVVGKKKEGHKKESHKKEKTCEDKKSESGSKVVDNHKKEKACEDKKSESGSKVVDKELEEVITKRCKRCSQYYVEKELAKSENKVPCRFHSGYLKTGYSSVLMSGARLQYWTCCKSSNKNDPGCKTGKHIEDPQMTNVQCRSISNQPQEPQVGVLIDIGQESEKKSETEKPEKVKNLIRHYVTDADTLIGLSFRYGVSAQSIRQLNRMPTDDVQAFSKLYIPRKGCQVSLSELDSDSEEEEEGLPQNLSEKEKLLFQKRILNKLRAHTGISNEEATYYLDMYGWAFSTALKEYQDDLEWEKSNPNKKISSRKCK